MPATFSCPDCQAILRTANPIPAGKKIKCPKCQTVFAVPAEDASSAAARQGSAAPQRKPALPDDDDFPRRPARRRADDYDDDEDSGEPIARRPLRKRAPVDDLDEDYDRDDESYDDYHDEDRPRRKSSRKRGKRKSGNGMLIGIIAGSLVVALLAVGAVTAWVWPGFLIGGTNKGTGNEDPLAYVPADTTMIFGLDGNTMFNNPTFGAQLQAQLQGKNSQEKDLFDDCKTNTGVEFKELFDRVIFAAKVPVGGGAAPMMGSMPQDLTVVLQSKVPFNQKTVSKHLKDTESVKVNGKIYYKRIHPGPQSGFTYLFMPSDRIMVLSNMPKDKLEALVSTDGSTPALASDTVSMIHKAEKATVWFVLPISGSMKQQIDQLPRPPAGQVPPELKPVVDAVPNAKALGVWGTLEGEKASLHVALTCADEASAKSVAGGLQSWWNANIKGLAGMAIRAALLKAPRSMQKVADELLSSTKFEYEGALAEASANAKMQSLEAVAKELPALVPQMGGFQQGGPAPGGQGFPRPGQPGGMRGGFGGQPGGFPNQPGGMRGGFPNQPIRPRQPGT